MWHGGIRVQKGESPVILFKSILAMLHLQQAASEHVTAASVSQGAALMLQR